MAAKVVISLTGKPIKGVTGFFQRFLRVATPEVEQQLAKDFLSFLRKGLKKNGLGLTPLTARTIAHKKSLNMQSPSAPLYGWGTSNPRSYHENLTVMKLKGGKGFKVGFHHRQNHHSGMLMQTLAVIHQEGNVNLPARDPLEAAYNRFKVQPSMFTIGKIVKNKVAGFWN